MIDGTIGFLFVPQLRDRQAVAVNEHSL